MINLLKNKMVNLKPFKKQIIIMLVDILLLSFSLFLSFSIRLNEVFYFEDIKYFLIYAVTLTSIPIFIRYGLYKEVTRYIGTNFLWVIFKAVSVYSLVWGLAIVILGLDLLPRSVIIMQWTFALLFISASRFVAKNFLNPYSNKIDNKNIKVQNVLIYGAGKAGMQLAGLIQYNHEFNLIGFIDDNKKLTGQKINGVNVYPLELIKKNKIKFSLKQIFVAIPSLSNKRKEILINKINELDVIIKTVPSLNEIANNSYKIDDLKEIRLEDLLGRKQINPKKNLIQKNIVNQNILVTGSGGSIGSEICKEIINYKPNSLILFESNEYSLFQIEQFLKMNNNSDKHINIKAVLGDIRNTDYFYNICKENNINTIFHTAAYKHVPLVEQNIIEGISNNILGTYSCVKAAIKANISNFVLISSDKAVRPTNIMGASKRFSEMIIQSISKDSIANLEKEHVDIKTKFVAVRFGNVLGSSGSVVPIFKDQIKKGGPITLTHKDIIRYFMSTKEAAQLVIQSGALGNGGEIFLLDMGKPVKIYDLAKQMILLSGLQIKDLNNPDGDIEIIITGMRPGEKLYEELLIDGHAMKTDHPRIYCANEKTLPLNIIQKALEELKVAIMKNNINQVEKIIEESVPELSRIKN